TVLKNDVTGLKADVTGLKADVTGLKADVTGLNDRQEKMESDIKALRVASRETHMKLEELSTSQKELKVKVDLTWQAVTELVTDSTRIDKLEDRVETIEKSVAL
ncbi:MAG: hypothetical protein GX958_05210, partial [Desulfitobacterium sp.]|nr:hypothetical protein [Desulfitobacterium sp.]